MKRLFAVLKWSGLAFVAAAVLFVAALAAVRLGFFDGLLVSVVKERVAKSGVDLKVDEVTFDPASFTFRAGRLSAADRNGEWSFEAGRASVTLHPIASLSGETTISVDVESPKIKASLKKTANKGVKGEGGSTSFSSWALHKVRIVDGSLDVEYPDSNARLTLRKINVDWLEKRGTGKIGEGSLTWRGEKEELFEASFEGERKIGDTRLEPFYLRTTRTSASGSLRIGMLDRLGGEFNLRADLRDLPKPWLEGLGLDGFAPVGSMIELLGQFGGTLSSPALGCEVEISEGRFGPLSVRSISGSVDLSEKGVKFRKFTLASSAGAVRGLEGRIDFGDRVTIDAEAETEGYDLYQSMALLKMEHFPVSLIASGKVSAKGELYPNLSLDCEGEKVKAKDFSVSTLHSGKIEEWYSIDSATVDFDATVMSDKIKFGGCRIESDSVDVDVKEGLITYHEGLEYDTSVKIKSLATVRRYLPPGFDASGVAVGRFGGPYRSLKFDYRLDFDKVTVFDRDIGEVKGNARYDLETLSFSDLSASGPLAEVKASGKVVLLPGGTFDVALALRRGDIAETASLVAAIGKFNNPDLVKGPFEADGVLSGPIKAPQFTGKLTSDALQIRPIGPFKGGAVENLSVAGVFGLKQWKAESFSLSALGATFGGEGYADLERFSVSAGVDGVALGKAAALVSDGADVAGVFSGKFKAEGPYRAARLEVGGEVKELRVGSVSLGDVDAVTRYFDGRLEVEAMRGDKAAEIVGAIEKSGEFTAEVFLRILPWSALPQAHLPEGLSAASLSGKGRVRGNVGFGGKGFSIASGEWNGTAEEFRVYENAFGKIEVAAKYPSDTGGAVRVEAALWGGEARVYTLFSPQGAFLPQIGLNLKGMDLARLSGVAPTILGGRADISATVLLEQMPPKARDVKGIMREVREFSAMGGVEGLALKGAPLIEAAKFEAGGAQGRWWLNGDATKIEKVEASLSTADFSWLVKARIKDFDPFDLVPQLKDKVAAKLDGDCSFAGTGSKVTDFSGSGRAVGLEGFHVGPHNGTWRIASVPGGAELNADVGATISAKANLRFEDNYLSASVAAQNASFEAWLPKEIAAKGYSGIFSGTCNVTGKLGGDFSANADISMLSVVSPYGKLKNKGALVISYREGSVFFESVKLESEEAEGQIGGSLRPLESFNLKVNALLDLGRLKKKMPRVEDVSGKARFQGTVSGEWNKPKISGAVEVRQGATVKVEKLAWSFTKLTAHGELNAPGELRIEAIDADFGEGKVHAEGRIILKDYLPDSLDLLISAKQINYEYPKGANYVFDGEFIVAGPFSQLELRGEAKLLSFLYTRQIKWRTATLSMLERAKKARVGTRETNDLFVDIAVLGDRNLRIENNLANLDLSSDIRIRGFIPTPQIWGRLDVNSGSLRFRGREYKLMRSNIEFLGDNTAVAVVDGRAVTSVGDYTINISATGPIEDIKVDMSSLPPLPRTDIVALLALGTTTEHLEKSEAVTALEATNILTGSLQDELEGQAYNIFGIDQFQVNPSYSQQAQASVPRITVGKSVSDSVFVKYSADIGSGQSQEVSLEYALKPGVVFLGSWNDEGTTESGSFGGQLRFRYSFR